ncbi:MAG: formate dehydrogenase accessory sulfurtransferase FdhD [Acidiferrobacteraceae bacterium]
MTRCSEAAVLIVGTDQCHWRPDEVAGEEPLEIRIAEGPAWMTLRTPGDDEELIAGSLFTEGIIRSRSDIAGIKQVGDCGNILEVTLTRSERDPSILARSGPAHAGCGWCGRSPWEPAKTGSPSSNILRIDRRILFALPQRLRRAQKTFERTGGLHAAALADESGALIVVREDIGRHNALDKLVGWALIEGCIPLDRCLLVLSGRAGYELIHKAAVAGLPIVAAISAPSDLAIRVARDRGITLAGFLRDDHVNLYSHPSRIRGLVPGSPGAANVRPDRSCELADQNR